jgi:predicted nucleic acid-binding protein
MIALDSNIIIDILEEGPTVEQSVVALRDALSLGPVVFSETTLAEVCGRGDSARAVLGIRTMGLSFVATEERAAIRAGEMMQRYRVRSKTKTRLIADFVIGAHALLQCHGLITYDTGFHRDYFKGLKVIVPGEQ